MIAKITYFDLKGYRIKTVSIKKEDFKIREVIFPGDFILGIMKMKEEGSLPEIEGIRYHLLVEVTSESAIISKLIPYDYLDEMEKIRKMSSKDIDSFIK